MKNARLKDGSEILIRKMTSQDLERSVGFFAALSPEDRAYLRRDVTQPEVVALRLREIDSSRVVRLIALVDDQIVADGSVEPSHEGWKSHVGELRLIVARTHRRNGLGMLMARELYGIAAAERVEQIIVRMMRPQTAARSIFTKLGFTEEAVLADYVSDMEGRKQDLILMRCDLEKLWRRMEDFVAFSDWMRTQ